MRGLGKFLGFQKCLLDRSALSSFFPSSFFMPQYVGSSSTCLVDPEVIWGAEAGSTGAAIWSTDYVNDLRFARGHLLPGCSPSTGHGPSLPTRSNAHTFIYQIPSEIVCKCVHVYVPRLLCACSSVNSETEEEG